MRNEIPAGDGLPRTLWEPSLRGIPRVEVLDSDRADVVFEAFRRQQFDREMRMASEMLWRY